MNRPPTTGEIYDALPFDQKAFVQGVVNGAASILVSMVELEVGEDPHTLGRHLAGAMLRDPAVMFEVARLVESLKSDDPPAVFGPPVSLRFGRADTSI